MAKDTVIVVRGRLDWAKITGEARPYTGNPKYDKGPNWSVDITPDAKSRKIIKAAGIESKLRQPKEGDSRTESFLTLRILENRPDGKKNLPPKIKDGHGRPWGEDLLGNGTVADVMIKVKDYGSGSEMGTYYQAARILEHVPYGGADFEPLSEDDQYFGSASGTSDSAASGDGSPNPDELDDDIPF